MVRLMKTAYAIRECWIDGEAGNVSEETITSWIERLEELNTGCSSENIWNMVKSGCFFKALPDKGLVEKGKQAKCGKKSKQRFTIAFFVNPGGGKVEEPLVIWKSGMPRCFRRLRHPSRTANVHYFSNPKSRMTLVMVAALKWFNRKLLFQHKKGRITLLVIWNQW